MHPLTMTHARIRAAQGDLAGARRVLSAMLDRRPNHAEARALLAELDRGGRADSQQAQHEELPLPQPVAGDPRTLAASFRHTLGRSVAPDPRHRIRRLARWLHRIASQRDRGAPSA